MCLIIGDSYENVQTLSTSISYVLTHSEHECLDAIFMHIDAWFSGVRWSYYTACEMVGHCREPVRSVYAQRANDYIKRRYVSV